MAEINVVPYIDVMLVLLVIFMITAPLLTQGVEVELPETASKPLLPEQHDPVVLSVDAQGRYFLNIGETPDQPVDPDSVGTLVAKVLKARPEVPVIVRGDRRVDYGAVVTAMSWLQAAGAEKVGLVTDMKPPEKP